MSNIGRRLALAFFCVIIFMVAQGVVAYLNTSSLSNLQQKVSNEELFVNHLRQETFQTRLTIYKLLGTMDPWEMDAARGLFDDRIGKLSENLMSLGLDSFLVQRNRDLYNRVIELQYNFMIKSARRLMNGQSKTVHDQLLGRLDQLAQAKIDQNRRLVDRAQHRALIIYLILLGAALAVASVWAYVLARSLTDRKLAEKALKESEERFRILTEESPLGISLLDAKGRYLYLNPTFVRMFGYSLDDIGTGSDWFDLAYPDPDYRQRVRDAWLEDLQNVTSGLPRPRTFEVMCKNGESRTILFRPVTISEGKQFIIYEDITEKTRMEEQRQKLQAQLAQAQKMDALGTLSSGIAHDFNNILAAILGYSELALDEVPKDNAPVRQGLAEIAKAAMKAKHLVRQILTFSRVANSEKLPLSLSRVAQESRAILERTLPKMIELRLDLKEELWLVNADPQQMEQVFINLSTNAADAIEGSGTITISAQNLETDTNFCQECGEELVGRWVIIKVKDEGEGMSPEVLAKIFEPFYTTKGVGKGTGLGLSTVYGIINGHGGHICCQSKEGEGSTFFIYLPANSQGQLELETKNEDAPQSLGGSGRILVVDDEPTVRDIARKMLSRSGYEVIQAASGEEALAIYEERKDEIDLVLMDLGMPGMGGKACLTEIRRVDPDARVLIASGYIQYELTDELESLGAAGMVAKPYRKTDILKAVKEALKS